MKQIELRDKDLAVLQETLSRFPSVREARVYGSRATGAARRASDLDLAVFAPEATAEEWANLCEALESTPIIYEIDVVRAERTSNVRLREKIEREGIVVYSNGGGEKESDGTREKDETRGLRQASTRPRAVRK